LFLKNKIRKYSKKQKYFLTRRANQCLGAGEIIACTIEPLTDVPLSGTPVAGIEYFRLGAVSKLRGLSPVVLTGWQWCSRCAER
jgi:hypothetical protein